MQEITILQWLVMTAAAGGATLAVLHKYWRHTQEVHEPFNWSKAFAAILAGGTLILAAAKAAQLPGPDAHWGTIETLSALFAAGSTGYTSALIGDGIKKLVRKATGN